MSVVKVTPIEEFKSIFLELLLNHTDQVTKVSTTSVLNGFAYGIAKLGQKTTKEIALVESKIFPDTAFGQYLDKVSENYGISGRFSATGSSTYVRVVGSQGTTYTPNVHTFISNSGVIFDVEEAFTIPLIGFGYVKIRSQTQGSSSNVDPLSINKVTPIPSGHTYCINEYYAIGGSDNESDELFRKRIKDGPNILARGTIAQLEQVFMKININVFKVFYHGIDADGKFVLAIMTQNGIDLNSGELQELLTKGNQYFSLSELSPQGTSYSGIRLINIDWFPIDISARVVLDNSLNPDDIRKQIQINLNKYIDYRFFTKTRVQWVDLYNIVNNTTGVKYVLDNFFTPNVDFDIPRNSCIRMRGFLLLNTDGTIIQNLSSSLNPIYYPRTADFSFQKTVFSTLT